MSQNVSYEIRVMSASMVKTICLDLIDYGFSFSVFHSGGRVPYHAAVKVMREIGKSGDPAP